MIFEVTFRNEPDYKLIAKALKTLYEKTEAIKAVEEKNKSADNQNTPPC